jgi:hypothetical protein
MNWTDLQENWVPLSDPDKFIKYAAENPEHRIVTAPKDSYFESDKGTFYDNITEFDFTDIPAIEKELLRITDHSSLRNTDLLARVIAVTMMKMMPREVSIRERFKEQNQAEDKSKSDTINVIEPHTSGITHIKKDENAPPDFYYPM